MKSLPVNQSGLRAAFCYTSHNPVGAGYRGVAASQHPVHNLTGPLALFSRGKVPIFIIC